MTIRNITMSADDRLIQLARKKAVAEDTSLNILFREWLNRYVGQDKASQSYKALMKNLSHVNAGKIFSRDELNER